MKSGISIKNLPVVLFVFLGLSIASCQRNATVQAPEAVRARQERAITITNRTGFQLSGYSVNVASSGVEIQKGSSSNDSFSIIISRSYDADPEIEVVLVDRYDRIYAKTFNVPLEGNTDTPITAEDRKSEGALTDGWKDIQAWFNQNK